eukprot:1154648-Pelagomonas_calceolata.AAC.3
MADAPRIRVVHDACELSLSLQQQERKHFCFDLETTKTTHGKTLHALVACGKDMAYTQHGAQQSLARAIRCWAALGWSSSNRS